MKRSGTQLAGDAVIADDDGVVVMARKYAGEVAARAEKRHADEEAKRKQLASGALGLDMYNMREPLAGGARLSRRAPDGLR
jgi:4-hydroxy-4-methyl-2-oxoglutarate aldolase